MLVYEGSQVEVYWASGSNRVVLKGKPHPERVVLTDVEDMKAVITALSHAVQEATNGD